MKKRIISFIFLIFIFTGIFKMFLISAQYFALEPNVNFLKTKHFAYKIQVWKLGFYFHVFTSFILLFTGITQFFSGLHRRFPKLHRYCGTVYLLVLLGVSAPSGMVLGWYANGGIAARASFLLMGLLWWVFSFVAWLKIRGRRWNEHGAFMLRSFSLTLSAITLRTYAMILSFIPWIMGPTEKYILIAWLSWVPNLIIAEWLIKKGFIRRYLTHVFKGKKL